MASASLSGDSFLTQVERVREEIGVKFHRAHQVLVDREEDLLLELQQLELSYKGGGVSEQIREITASKEQLIAIMKGNENQETLKQSVAPLDARMKELEIGLETVKDKLGSVVFEWDGELERMLSETGVIRVRAALDYKKKGEPVKTACKFQKGRTITDGVFHCPTSIAICPKTENIYISDGDANIVQVFTKSFEFLFKFSEKMNEPFGMCISENKLFVIQFKGNTLNVYSTEGEFLQSVGRRGGKQTEFNSPSSISATSVKRLIYICDTENLRIQCLNLDLTFHSFIPTDVRPLRIHCTSEEIIVLKAKSPCISFYNYSHKLVKEIIPIGESTIKAPVNFYVDHQNNILFTDFSANCVVIFSNNEELIHKFGQKGEGRGEFIDPMAIALDSEDRIIVASKNPEHCLQLF